MRSTCDLKMKNFKVGDLVTIRPSKVGLYLIIDEGDGIDHMYNKLWVLWGKDVQCVPMAEEFIETISRACLK